MRNNETPGGCWQAVRGKGKIDQTEVPSATLGLASLVPKKPSF